MYVPTCLKVFLYPKTSGIEASRVFPRLLNCEYCGGGAALKLQIKFSAFSQLVWRHLVVLIWVLSYDWCDMKLHGISRGACARLPSHTIGRSQNKTHPKFQWQSATPFFHHPLRATANCPTSLLRADYYTLGAIGLACLKRAIAPLVPLLPQPGNAIEGPRPLGPYKPFLCFVLA